MMLLKWAASERLAALAVASQGLIMRLPAAGPPRMSAFLIAPPELRTADPIVASDFEAGQFAFSGKIAITGDASPFVIEPPSEAWAEALAGFGWLRHLQAARSTAARDIAKRLLSDFVAAQRDMGDVAARPDVTSRRVLSILTHSPLLLDGAEHETYADCLALIRSDTRRLVTLRAAMLPPDLRLRVLIALTMVGLCVEGAEKLQRRHGEELAFELDEQVLADGGHLTRNPRVLVELMLDLLPLRAAHAARGADPPHGLVGALDRIVPHLKLLRHPDGGLAQFNGMGDSRLDALATIFASHDTTGRAATSAPFTGYHRLEAGPAVLIVDTGPPPLPTASLQAHASCAAIEFSHGRQRLFIGCGLPGGLGLRLPLALRSTAAHSAVVVDDRSAGRFLQRNGEARLLPGPRVVEVATGTSPAGEQLAVSHDGYRDIGVAMLKRTLTLSADGDRLTGQDALVLSDGVAAPRAVARFHLHPLLRAGMIEAGVALLQVPAGRPWLFSVRGATLSIDDSICYSGVEGARRTLQLVATFDDAQAALDWRLERQPE